MIITDDERTARKVFADTLHAARAEKRWTATALGKELEVDSSSISNWERGFCKPSRQSFDRLVALFPNLAGTLEPFIHVPNKPSGIPPEFPHKGGKKKGQKTAAPAYPPVRSKGMGRVAKDTQAKNALVTLTIQLSLLEKIAAEMVIEASSRAELIKSLREAGQSDSFILDLIHRVLDWDEEIVRASTRYAKELAEEEKG